MNFKHKLKTLRDNYVIRQVSAAVLPDFPPSPVRRYRILFSGRVQRVGFRLEVCQMARRLGLTGFCKNLENGDVLAEIQGPDCKIQYLLSFMESLKRIRIRRKTVTALDLDPQENAFTRQ